MSAPGGALDPRTRKLLDAPILPTLVRLAWPNVLVLLAQASTGLIETYWVGKLGTDALAGMALVFPGVMLMQMLSGGALGGGISSAVARALGSGRRDDADALVLHALVINVAIGAAFSAALLLFGRPFYRALGGEGASLEAALTYSNVVFCGMPLLFAMNALASVVRGTGNMLVPALVTCIGVVLLLPLSPLLIFGWGPVPGLGVAGGGFALLAFYAAGLAVLGWYLVAGRSVVQPRAARLRWALSRDILRIGAVAAISSVQTNVVIGGATALVGLAAGPEALAGFGTAARLEYLMVSLVFGIGAPLVALVGTSIGAGQRARALKVAWCGCALAFAVTESIGVAAAIWPRAWLGLFGDDPQMLAAGSVYLQIVGPFFGFFAIGLSLYFASQGAGRLFWPLIGGFIRMSVALGAGWLAMRLTGRLEALYAALALGLTIYGATVATAVWRGVWFPAERQVGPGSPRLRAGAARA